MDHAPKFLETVLKSKSKVKEITVDSVALMLERNEKLVLVDVREDSEWDKSHLKNAIHLGKGVIERDIEKAIPDFAARIVLYCGGGFRSALAADAIQQMGYTDVFSLEGGFKAWCNKNLPMGKS